jgi:hypothetical protein
VIGREVFRELVVDTGCGSPTAVRHRDGFGYLLIAESEHRAVYRKAANPAAWWGRRDKCTAPAAVLQGYFAN